jgi:CBS domain-containing protein
MNFTPQFYIAGEENSRTLADNSQSESVTQYMAKHLITFNPQQTIGEVVKAMLKHKISGAPVVNEQGVLIGLISEKDCLKVMLDFAYHNQPLRSSKVVDYMTTEVTTVSSDANVFDVASLFVKTNFRRFPVLAQGKLVGQVSRRDILKAAQRMKATTW